MTTVTFPVQSSEYVIFGPAPCGTIPSIAQAYSFNLTVVPAGAAGLAAGGAVDYVTLWPSGSPQPFVSTLDDSQGLIVANAAIVSAGTPFGGISVYNAGPATTDVVIDMNGYFAAPTDFNNNTALGAGSLANNTLGSDNTAGGYSALQNNTTGSDNTASGYEALTSNTAGTDNTASGSYALAGNTTGVNNTASGYDALGGNNGNNNTASGYYALAGNYSGNNNTASGTRALGTNAIGNNNTATGYFALEANYSGSDNTANGTSALQSNIWGGNNTASGFGALMNNTTGNLNTAIGFNALGINTTGSNNIAIGSGAGSNVQGGWSNNIAIGNYGVSGDGATANNGVIRIGTVGTQTSAYIAGIYGGTPSSPNLPVCVDANGALGTTGCTSPPSAQIQLNEAQRENAKIEQLEKRLAALETLLSGQASAAARPAGSQ